MASFFFFWLLIPKEGSVCILAIFCLALPRPFNYVYPYKFIRGRSFCTKTILPHSPSQIIPAMFISSQVRPYSSNTKNKIVPKPKDKLITDLWTYTYRHSWNDLTQTVGGYDWWPFITTRCDIDKYLIKAALNYH